MKKNQNRLYICIIIALLAIAGFCGYLLIDNRVQQVKESNVFTELAETVEQAEAIPFTFDAPSTENALLCVYQDLARQNPDMVGWIRIEGTTVNYPVMQTPDRPNYYLRRNFYREYSNLGTPYIQENCDLATSYNLILYGHHMLAGGMFSDLEYFKDESFWKEHQKIRFDTLDEIAEYEIFAVVKTVAYSPDSFKYYEYVGDGIDEDADAKEFDDYVAACKTLALYDTGISAVYGDKLITLSTCEYSTDNGRLIVVAKKVKE